MYGKSSLYDRKNSGPCIELCGKPYLTSPQWELFLEYSCHWIGSWVGPGASHNSWVGPGASHNSWVGPGASHDSWVGPGASHDSWVGPGASHDSCVGSGASHDSCVGSGASHDISEKRKSFLLLLGIRGTCWLQPVNDIKVDLTRELAIISLQPKTPQTNISYHLLTESQHNH